MSTPSSRDAPRHGNETSLSLLERIKGKDNQAWQRLLDLYRPLTRRQNTQVSPLAGRNYTP